jgi:RNA polymerase sigma-70 factor, ECF subfamily
MDGMPEEAVAITTHSRADADSRDDAEQAFQRAVLPERPRLYALALTITRDPAEREDIVQETMLSAWRSWAQVRDPTHPGPWLTRICVNHCLQHRRKVSRIWQSGAMSDATAAAPIQFDGELLDFDRAFARLSVKQRAVFALHIHHGYSVDECARLLGCRSGTARSHLGRAVATLRREMNHA